MGSEINAPHRADTHDALTPRSRIGRTEVSRRGSSDEEQAGVRRPSRPAPRSRSAVDSVTRPTDHPRPRCTRAVTRISHVATICCSEINITARPRPEGPPAHRRADCSSRTWRPKDAGRRTLDASHPRGGCPCEDGAPARHSETLGGRSRAAPCAIVSAKYRAGRSPHRAPFPRPPRCAAVRFRTKDPAAPRRVSNLCRGDAASSPSGKQAPPWPGAAPPSARRPR